MKVAKTEGAWGFGIVLGNKAGVIAFYKWVVILW